MIDDELLCYLKTVDIVGVQHRVHYGHFQKKTLKQHQCDGYNSGQTRNCLV